MARLRSARAGAGDRDLYQLQLQCMSSGSSVVAIIILARSTLFDVDSTVDPGDLNATHAFARTRHAMCFGSPILVSFSPARRYRLVPNRILNRLAYIMKIQYKNSIPKKSRLCVTPTSGGIREILRKIQPGRARAARII